MALTERDLVPRLLKQSILTLCREAVAFKSRLEVDGIICLTVDNQDQHVVKIHEFFDKITERETVHPSVRSASNELRPSAGRTIIRYAPNTQTEKDIHNQSFPGIENTVIKTEPTEDTDSNKEIKLHEDTGRGDCPETVKPTKRIHLNSFTSVDYTSMGLDNLIMSSARNIPCKKCNSLIESVTLFQVHNMTSHGQFTCLVCLATFTSRNNMKRHIRLHTGIKPYSCHKCPESFSRNDDFKRHLLKHTFQKPFRCAVCNTGYIDRACVKNHMIKEHNCKVFHICPQCGESFIELQKFQKHKMCHPEFQDYRCSLCSFTGSNALMYNKHMLSHGPPKEYRCTHCDVSYSDPFMYTGHLKKHKGDELVKSFTCCFCDMSLPSFEQFQRHEHTHVHSKQHVCNQCNKIFRYPSNLREHMLIHVPKSGFSGTEQHPQYAEGLHDARNGDNVSAATTEHSNFNNKEEMDTEEENNNNIDTDKEPFDAQFPEKDDVSGSSEYWCTECNQGFGSESKLKNHITYKHETKVIETEDDGEEAARRIDFLNAVKITESLEVETPSVHQNNNICTEINQSILSNSHLYNENTMEEHLKSTQNAPLLFQSKQKQAMKEEEAAVVKTDCSTNVLDKDAACDNAAYPPDGITETKLNTVKDAMREVQNIQFRFGIKPTGLELLKSDMKETNKRLADGDVVVERSNNLCSLACSNVTTPSKTSTQQEESICVSVSGTKMKIQRTPCILTELSDSEHGCANNSSAKDSNSDNKFPAGCTDKTNNDSSIPCSRLPAVRMDTDFSVTPRRRSATTLNLQVRNPGFERVVTPDVLFSTKAPFTCEVCEETFESFDDFHEHGVKVHRRFICSYCGKVFTSRPNRERHIRYHTGEKPYKCDICSASFLRGDDLKYHRTTKHADIKPFTCGACQTSFSLPKDLEKHLKIYSDHRL